MKLFYLIFLTKTNIIFIKEIQQLNLGNFIFTFAFRENVENFSKKGSVSVRKAFNGSLMYNAKLIKTLLYYCVFIIDPTWR